MARDFLSASGIGVAVECLFSIGPDVLGIRRQAMMPETLRQNMCLKSWLKLRENKNAIKQDIIESMIEVLGSDI